MGRSSVRTSRCIAGEKMSPGLAFLRPPDQPRQRPLVRVDLLGRGLFREVGRVASSFWCTAT